jgi:Na+/H+ antiporter NhaD/arsenite permease-like protein
MMYVVIAIAVIAYALVSVFPSKKEWISLSAGAILLAIGALTGMVSLSDAFLSFINWNVLAIYVGSLILAELFIYSKVPAVFAEWIANKASSAGLAIAIICVFTGLVSAFVENVATVLVVAPIAIEIAKRVKVPVGPVLVLLALNANLQGTATLVGDPPSMLFAGTAGFSFNDFFFYQGKISIFFFVQIGALAAFAFSLFAFRKYSARPEVPRESKVVSWIPLVLLVAMVGALAWNSMHEEGVGVGAGLICLGTAALGQLWFVAIRKEKVKEAFTIVKNLDWGTMLFLIGIFLMLGMLNASGAVKELASFLSRSLGGDVLLTYEVIVVISVLISGFVDNVPYIALMLPIISTLAGDLHTDPTLLYFGLLIGSCLGGNVTPFGASANIVATGLAKKHGDEVSVLGFVKIGLPFTLLTTAVAAAAAWLVWHM